MSFKVLFICDYPKGKASTVDVDKKSTWASVKEAAAKALDISIKAGWTFSVVAYGKLPKDLNKTEDKTDATSFLSANDTVITFAPAHLKPLTKRVKKDKKEEKKASVDTSVYKAFNKKNIIKKFEGFNETKNAKQKKYALEYIEMYAKDVFASSEFKALSGALVTEILKMDRLNCKELDVYNAAIAWAEAECKRLKKDSTKSDDLKAVMKDVMTAIRFPCMELQDIATNVEKHGLLDQSQLLSLFTYIGQRSLDSKSSLDSNIKIFSAKPRNPRWPVGSFKFDNNKKGTYMALNDEDMTVLQTSGTSSWNTCLLTPSIKEGVHKIKFKIKSDARSHWIFIGCATTSYSSWQNYIGSSSGTSWGWSNAGYPGSSGKIYPSGNSYGTGFKTGDVVTMTVNMEAQTIAFALNTDETPSSSAFTSIGSEVYAAVTTYDQSDEVSLLVDK